MSQKPKLRKHLSADSMIRRMREHFETIPDHRAKNIKYTLPDAIMAGFAMFSLKCPSLLQFDNKRKDEVELGNIKSIYNIEKVPCDSQMRNILDELDPNEIRPVFKTIFAQLQRGKVLEKMTYFDNYYLLSIDGIEVFKSKKIFSDNCLIRNRKDGSIEYYQQFLGAVIVNPERKEVIPICPEMIIKQDGETKNDCERNASKRFLKKFRNDHPYLKTIVVEDALAANAPHIKELYKYNCRYIISVKPKGNKFIFDSFEKLKDEDPDKVTDLEIEQLVSYNPAGGKMKKPKTVVHKFRFANAMELNESNKDISVNFLDYQEIDNRTGIVKKFSWITDFEITRENVYKLMRSGRARWKIENETFNTLTNQDYKLKHNYGLGKKNLSIIFIFLMMLAFLIDQIQQLCCPLFKAALEKAVRKKYLWSKMLSIFEIFKINSIETMLKAIAYGIKSKPLDIL